MNRAEQRRINKQEEKKKKVYNLTQEQLDEMIEQRLSEELKNTAEDSTLIAFKLMLAIPVKVLSGKGYWEKTYKQKMPKFLDEVIDMYKKCEAGEISMDDMQKDLWELGGIKFEE